MEVRAGWATQYGERKYDVSTSEVDLIRMLLAAEISPAYHAKVPAETVWALLDVEARWLAEHALARYLKSTDNEDAATAAEARVKGCARERSALIAKLKEGLGLVKEQSEPPSGE